MKYFAFATYVLLSLPAIGQNPTANGLRFYSQDQSYAKKHDTIFACKGDNFEGVFCKSAEIKQAKILDTIYASFDSTLFTGVLIECVLKRDSNDHYLPNTWSQVICNYVNGSLDTTKTIFFKYVEQDPENLSSTDSSKGYFTQITYKTSSKNVGFLFNESGFLHTKYLTYKTGDTIVRKVYHYSGLNRNAIVSFNYSTSNITIDSSYSYKGDRLVYELIRTYKTDGRRHDKHHGNCKRLIDIGSENVIFLNRYNRPISEANFLRKLKRRNYFQLSQFVIPLTLQKNSNGYQIILYINYKFSRNPCKNSIYTILTRHNKWLNKKAA